jgi:TonB-linked SusC/RagA family outer membrane protein
MKILLKPSLLLVMILHFFCAKAQEKKTIAGTITDSSGAPVVAATIQEKDKKNFTTSDAAGHFTIKVTPGAVLVVSYTGFQTVDVPTDNAAPAITMHASQNGLEGVVVTALGIKRQRKALGYSVQEVKGETLEAIKDPNLTNDLTGQVAGLQVVRSGNGPAGSSQIKLRGNNSLTLSQPLIVVDGMPISNNTGRVGVNATNDFYNPSLDMGNGLSDINPDDIATLTVLKGPAGAALYGSLGGNGVIIITTKSGHKQPGAGVSVSSTVGVESVFTAPKTQNVFGEGSNGVYDPATTTSWGPQMTGQTVTGYDGKSVPLQPYNNVRNYLNSGVQSTQNVSFSQQVGATSVYASYSRLDDKSIIPGASLARNNITARTVTKLGQNQRWTFDTKVQFINATAKNRPLEGSNTNNVFLTLNTMPRSLDIRRLSNDVDSTGKMIWYTTKQQNDNPYWDQKYKLNEDTRNRFILYASAKYQFTPWLDAQLVGSDDMFTTSQNAHQYYGAPTNLPGSYSLGNENYYQTNYSTLITAKKDNLFGKLGGSFMVGGNLQSYQDNSFTASAGTLRVPNLFTINNAAGNPTFGQLYSAKAINSVYASLEADYDGYLFLNATWRNDWSSALSKANRAFSYPSVNASFVYTDMLQNQGHTLPSWLSFGKVRAGYATAGSDLDPYQLYNTYTIVLDPNNNTAAQPTPLPNGQVVLFDPNIKSQLIKSVELGTEMRFFKSGLLGFDFTWYKSNATNQIIYLPMDPLSGYNARVINAGNIQNAGVELSVDARILSRPGAFNWTTSVNFSHNNNVVKSLYPGVSKYQLGGFDQVSVNAVAGQQYGQIYGTQILRVTDPKDPNYGKPILNNGLPQQTSYDTLLGNQQAKALIGWTNRFSYKHFSLSVLLDASLGGKEFSFTLASMETAGTAAATVVNGRRDSMLVAGVQGTAGNYTANTTRVSPQQYWTALGTGNTGITEQNIYDASNIRIRNIQLSYMLPKSVVAGSVFTRASLTLSCNNVWMISSHMHGLDPESSYATGSPAVGFESGAVPSTRTYLATLSFGF